MTQRDGRLTAATTARGILWLTWAWVLLDLVLLLTAFVLQLLGADPDVPFARWVYGSAERAMAPFRGLFTPVALTGRSVLDTSLLFAMTVYGLAALILQQLIDGLMAWSARRRDDLAAVTPSVVANGRDQAGSADDRRRPPPRYPDLVVPARAPGESAGR